MARPMFEAIVYVLCFLTSATCAWLLMSSYRRYRQAPWTGSPPNALHSWIL